MKILKKKNRKFTNSDNKNNRKLHTFTTKGLELHRLAVFFLRTIEL